MNQEKKDMMDKLFRASRSHMDPEAWEHLIKAYASTCEPEELPEVLSSHAGHLRFPDFLPDLARLEWAVYEAGSSKASSQLPVSRLTVNPTLRLLRFSWKHLPALLDSRDNCPATYPEKGGIRTLVATPEKWRTHGSFRIE